MNSFITRNRQIIREQLNAANSNNNLNPSPLDNFTPRESFKNIALRNAIDDEEQTTIGKYYSSLSSPQARQSILNSDDLHEAAIFSAITVQYNCAPNNKQENFRSDQGTKNIDPSVAKIVENHKILKCVSIECPEPLYKSLKVGDSVNAKYSDGKYYLAKIRAVIHGGYSCAKYDVEYINFKSSHLQNLSWKDIKSIKDSKLSGTNRGEVERIGRDMDRDGDESNHFRSTITNRPTSFDDAQHMNHFVMKAESNLTDSSSPPAASERGRVVDVFGRDRDLLTTSGDAINNAMRSQDNNRAKPAFQHDTLQRNGHEGVLRSRGPLEVSAARSASSVMASTLQCNSIPSPSEVEAATLRKRTVAALLSCSSSTSPSSSLLLPSPKRKPPSHPSSSTNLFTSSAVPPVPGRAGDSSGDKMSRVTTGTTPVREVGAHGQASLPSLCTEEILNLDFLSNRPKGSWKTKR